LESRQSNDQLIGVVDSMIGAKAPPVKTADR
jgi:hypothetical protein